MEEAGTSQNPFPPFGRRMIDEFHFSGRKFTAYLGLDHYQILQTVPIDFVDEPSFKDVLCILNFELLGGLSSYESKVG